MTKLSKRGESQSSRSPAILRLIEPIATISKKIHIPNWNDVKWLYRLINDIFLVVYAFYLDKKIFTIFGIAIAVIPAVSIGEYTNALISIPILWLCYNIIYNHIVVWGAGRSHFVGKFIFLFINLYAQFVISFVTIGLPWFGLGLGAAYWTIMGKFAPKNGHFSIIDEWQGGAKQIPYMHVKKGHQNYIRSLEGRVNKTMFLGIPLTDEEATTSFIVFGEVRTGKSLILSMLMESIKE